MNKISVSAEPNINPEDIVRRLLDLTNISGPPTDAHLIASYLNLQVVEFEDYRGLNLPSNVRAFLDPSNRVIGVYKGFPSRQKTFSILHEVGHFVLPGHATHPQLLKGEDRIFDKNQDLNAHNNIIQLEIEANQFAADCLFQLDHFDFRVTREDLTWENIKQAAQDFDASFEATARRWVERSEQDCALVVFNPTNREDPVSALNVMYTITSASFRRNHFLSVPNVSMGSDSIIFDFFHNPINHPEILLAESNINIAGVGIKAYDIALFSNTYRVFGLITPTEVASPPPRQVDDIPF